MSLAGWTGTIYLFGFIPVYSGCYAANDAQKRSWELGLRPVIRFLVRLRWKQL